MFYLYLWEAFFVFSVLLPKPMNLLLWLLKPVEAIKKAMVAYGKVKEVEKEIGVKKYLPEIEKLGKMRFPNHQSTKEIQKIAENSLKTKKVVSITIGPNNVHDILDSLEENH